MRERYDIAFLGGGPAGYQGAIRAAQLGARVAVVEERELGGVCLNRGCIPTKTVRASAETGRTLRRAREFGFAPVEAVPDIAAIIARKNRVVGALRSSIERLFQARRIDLVEGRGHLTSPKSIEVQGPIAVAMQAGLPSRALMETIHVHPTLSKGILEVAQALHGQAIHLPPETPAP